LKAAEYEANNFIGKPFEVAEVRVRVGAQLQIKRATDRLERHGDLLEEEVRTRTAALRGALGREKVAREQLHEAHLDTPRRLALAAEFKDSRTAEHLGEMEGAQEANPDGESFRLETRWRDPMGD